MSKPPFKRVEELFHQAAALDPTERAGFLDAACAGDTDLRAAVEEILRHHTADKDTEDFLVSPLTRAAAAGAVPFAEAPTQPALGAATEPAAIARLPHIPGYTILTELGRGGMGVVYKALQIPLNRIVALKMLSPMALIAADHLARFRSEAEALAKLHHPNIVPIYDFGECDGQPYFTMAYVPGPSLSQLTDGRAQDIGQSARLVGILARAVHAVHECGIIHRDLKPGNVLMAPATDPATTSGNGANATATLSSVSMISDFGLAISATATRRLTVTGATIGTPAYMAPEQVRAKAGTVGPATDVYALGSILYELLTGRPPFDADTPAETIAQLLRDEPLSPSQLRPRLPRDLVTICLKCLEKSPRKRFATALELAEELQRFQRGEPIHSRPVGRIERAYRWCKRQPLAAALLAICSALLVALVATVLVYNARLRQALAEQHTQIVQLNIQIGTSELDQGDAFAACLRFAEALRLDRENPGEIYAHRQRITRALHQCPHLVEMKTDDKRALTEASHYARSSPDGRLTVTLDGETGARVWDTATKKAITPPLRHGAPLVAAGFIDGGKRLITVGARGTVFVWELPGKDHERWIAALDSRSPAELVQLARLLACRRIAENQEMVRLEPERLHEAWRKLTRATE